MNTTKSILLGLAAQRIQRGAGHTHAGVEAARATGATLIVARHVLVPGLTEPGVKVRSFADLASGHVTGPLIVDAECIQWLAGVTCEGPYLAAGADGESTEVA